MRGLTASELLDIRDRGHARSLGERALILLEAAEPDMDEAARGSLTAGERDARLIGLRACTFGDVIGAIARCPRCDEALELDVAAADLRVDAPAGSRAGEPLAVSGYALHVRPPDAADLAAIAMRLEPDAARSLLLERCVRVADSHGAAVALDEVPDDVLTAAVTSMAERDPQADLQLALSCPACGAQWETGFDIVAFFWAEIEAWSARIVRDVHALASAYGWREADILAMSADRRRRYLELFGA